MIATLQDYLDRAALPLQTVRDSKDNLSSASGRMYSSWTLTPGAGAAPTSAVTPTRTTVGAMGQLDAVGVQRLARALTSIANPAVWIVCDRLSHQGGLSGIVTTPQTTNLPTAALTRYTSGVGVLVALEIYSAVGTTLQAPTVEYTNQAGVGGRVSPPAWFGGTDNREARRLIPVSLQAGDTGVRSVQSVTLGASTGTAGNFGVTLYRPLFPLIGSSTVTEPVRTDALLNLGGLMPVVEPGACLFYATMGAANTGAMLNELRFIEE
jgi:hypothetical protein